MHLPFSIFDFRFGRGFLVLACLLVVLAASCARQSSKVETVTISNVEPRRDVSGRIIDAHCGCLQFFAGRFYLYGMAYGTNQNSLALNCPIVVYSSPDLQQWTYEGKLLQEQPQGVYTRPCVVFNPKTGKYVLWYNWFPKLWDGQAGVAVSDSPVGPFKGVNGRAHLAGLRPGDGSLFVDEDGTGYYIYTDMEEDYALRVECLTQDFLDSTHKISNIMATGAEAPVLFRRNNIYYVLCGPLCPDCPRGSEVQVFASASPLGPFSTQPSSNINRGFLDTNANLPSPETALSNRPGNSIPMRPAQGSWFSIRPESSFPIVPAQQSWVAKIPAAGGPAFVWIGDRWESAPDGIKGHDFQFWSEPLEFSADGRILPMKNIARWYITWTFRN